ncbi:MAG: hypothetical protein ACRCST_10415 [Turicibacter sp.]
MSKQLTIQIKGSNWTVKMLTPRKFIKLHKDWAAMTLPDSKEIHFRTDFFLPHFIRHELLHAFVSETGVENVKMDIDDMEELCCTIVGDFGIDIIKIADYILIFFNSSFDTKK